MFNKIKNIFLLLSLVGSSVSFGYYLSELVNQQKIIKLRLANNQVEYERDMITIEKNALEHQTNNLLNENAKLKNSKDRV